jgi:glycosidase
MFLVNINAQKTGDFSRPPKWASDVIWYQIFVERFNNGDSANDPTAESIYAQSDYYTIPANWSVTPWTGNWYKEDGWAGNLEGDFYSKLQLRRYGGDLQGVIDKLDYLEELGVTAIYFNPLNDAPSLHKFDARNWRHIDINFGPDPEGDLNIISGEDPSDASTWKWTSADKLFLKLVEQLHERGIKVIIDYSWNHTGVEFWAMKDIMRKQQNSKYVDWYDIEAFDDPSTPENEFKYHGWFNLESLPEIKKVNITSPRKAGHPYEGDINEAAKRHIFAVSKRWLSPDGDISKGIDGYRLDVADHIGLGFWRDYRKYVKSVKPDAYLVGEIWWESWPDKLMNPAPYLQGDIFDAVMFYHLYRWARYFFANTELKMDARQLTDSLNFEWSRIPEPLRYSMMNTAATHDSPRLLTSFFNRGLYKYWAKPNDDPGYKTGKPDEETYKRLKLYLIHQFTIPGAPQIWNGDEMGMWGADDPDCRKPLWWDDMKFDKEFRNNFQPGEKKFDSVGFNHELFDFYKKIISLRKQNNVLSNGDIEFVFAQDFKLAYKRFDNKNEILILFNLGTDGFDYPLEKDKVYTDLLSGKKYRGIIKIKGLASAVLKVE